MTTQPSRLRVVARGLAALMFLAVLVIGVPAFLVAAVGWPLPHRVPDINAIGDALAGRTAIDDAVWFAALACIAWVVWARVTVAVASETVAAVRHAPHRRGDAAQVVI